MSAEYLPEEILLQIFEYSLFEPCNHDECRYVRPCIENHLPLWYLGRRWRTFLEPLIFRSICLDWRNGSSRDAQSSYRSNVISGILMRHPSLWQQAQKLELGISSFKDEDVDDTAYAMEAFRRGTETHTNILLRGSWQIWAALDNFNSPMSRSIQKTHNRDGCIESSLAPRSLIDYQGYTDPLEALELEGCDLPAWKLRGLMKCPRALKKLRIVTTKETLLGNSYTRLSLQPALNHQKHSLESVTIRSYGYNVEGYDYSRHAGQDQSPVRVVDFRSFSCLKSLTLSPINVILYHDPENVAVYLAAPNLETLTIDFCPDGDRSVPLNNDFHSSWVEWFSDFVRLRSSIVQNDIFKEIDLVWNFDECGQWFDIKDAEMHFQEGPYPLRAFREIDAYTETFGVRFGSRNSGPSLQRWFDKAQEVLEIYDKGRDAYDFNVTGPHLWIFDYGKHCIYGGRPLPVTLTHLGVHISELGMPH